MSKSNVQTYHNTDSYLRGNGNTHVKAAHRYEVISADTERSLVGKKFHFIGVGGIGMSGLAQLLLKHHAIVVGSDQTPSAVTTNLSNLGADIRIGHNSDNFNSETDAVVISAAIRQDNPELIPARKRGCRVYKYAEMLGELMNRYEGIAVAGTHGKSTTSGWLTFLLKQVGIDVSFIVGAEISQLGSSSGVGDSEYFVAEACEYDRSFLNLRPKIACILNIEQDHLDYYKNEGEIVAAFADFALGTKPNGVVIANGQDPHVAKIIAESGFRESGSLVHCETFGLDRGCDFCARNITLHDGLYAFDVYHHGDLLGPTRISLPGEHNIQNALAVVAMAVNVGVPAEQVLHWLGDFTGVDRRLMLKGQFVVRNAPCVIRSARNTRNTQHATRNTRYATRHTKITVLDDYAHHPTEIRATLQAIRQRYEPRRICCVFQPHQYSRTRFLLDDFAESFKLADVTIVPKIYFVRDSQQSKKAVNAQMLVERIKASGTDAVFIDDFEAICDYLMANVTAGDLVVTMGAGDVWKVADEYIQRLRGHS